MTQKQKDKLVELYFQTADENYYYKCIEQFVSYQNVRHNRHILSKTKPDAVVAWIKLISFDTNAMLYLGAMLSLKENNPEYLDNALYSTNVLNQLCMRGSDSDHSIYAWNELPVLMSANKFKDIELIFPEENGLSANGMPLLKAITNLVMYLYYGKAEWKEKAVADGVKLINSKAGVKDKAVVNCLLSLVEKDFDKFSTELSNVCKGKKKSRLYQDNSFTRNFSFFALGLYNFAHYLYGEEAEQTAIPDDDNFPADLHEYQKSNGYKPGKNFITFDSPLELLNDIFNVDLPTMHLYYKGKKGFTDVDRYLYEAIDRILKK